MTYVWEQDMSIENREQQVDQLLRGIYRMCVNRDDCKDCPFYITKCTFGEPRPSTWFDEETIGNKFSPNYLKFTDRDIVITAKEEASVPVQEEVQVASQAEAKAEAQPEQEKAAATWPALQPAPESAPSADSQPAPTPVLQPVVQQAVNDDADGTWLVSTTMGSVFTKYVFICSKCGYRKESMFSFTPMTNCPECEKRKAGII
jgi:hypothetical protein